MKHKSTDQEGPSIIKICQGCKFFRRNEVVPFPGAQNWMFVYSCKKMDKKIKESLTPHNVFCPDWCPFNK